MLISGPNPDKSMPAQIGRAAIEDRRIRHLSTDHGCDHHRSGWEYALGQLNRMTHPGGVLLDSMIENTYSWHLEKFRSRLPLREPWVGIVHNPPNIPEDFFPDARPQSYCATGLFQDGLQHCRGLLALSEYQARWFRQFDVPVDVVRHPIDLDVAPFQWDSYRVAAPRRVLHIGWWLRRLQSFSDLAARGYRKVLLSLPNPNATRAIGSVRWKDVEIVPYKSNFEYDRLLQQSVVFTDLVDASANNVVLDCIARATPLVINRHPAAEEYLGREYPLFYGSLDEAAELLRSDDALLAAHRYLAEPAFRQRYSGESFVKAVQASSVYRSLPVRGE
jgi:hypothetical protein